MADFFAKLKKTFDKGVNTVSIKSNTLVEINKVKNEIHTINTNIQQQKNELSNKFYNMYLQDEIDIEVCKVFCERIKELERQSDEKEREIEEIKAKEEILLTEANKKIEESINESKVNKEDIKEETVVKVEVPIEKKEIVEKVEEIKEMVEEVGEVGEQVGIVKEIDTTLDK